MKELYNMYIEGKYHHSQELDIEDVNPAGAPYKISTEYDEIEWVLAKEDENFI